MGLEPTTFELDNQRADKLRHEGTSLVEDLVVYKVGYWQKFYCILKQFKFFVHYKS